MALVLLTMGLAGCAGGGPPADGDQTSGDGAVSGGEPSDDGSADAGGGAPFTAQRQLDTARGEAASWSSAAELVGAATVEAPSEDAQTAGADAWGAQVPDETVGDGEAPAWSYHFFSSAENAWLTVTVHADGATETNETDDSHGLSSSISSWNVSSAQAVSIAKDHDRFANVSDDEGATVAVTLMDPGSGPIWRVRAHSPEADSSPGIEVDANTGQSYQYAS